MMFAAIFRLLRLDRVHRERRKPPDRFVGKLCAAHEPRAGDEPHLLAELLVRDRKAAQLGALGSVTGRTLS
jgi:hypothetical protein